ncbi:MAG: carboxypeptidase-like regulatory domain-containing protein, partial [Chitinophaga rupis]
MKLTVVFNCILCLHLSAAGYSQTKVTLHLHNATLNEIFLEIEKKTEFRFVFNDDVLKNESKTDVVVKDAPVTEVLAELLWKTSLDFKIRDENLVVIVNKIEDPKALPVHGTILNSRGQPLSGVSVLEKGTHNGVNTHEKGEFFITVKDNNAVLVISSIGYLAQEYKVSGDAPVSISLVEDFSKLNDVVVVGYGTQKKASLTGAVAVVSAATFQDRGPIASPVAALQGQVPGVIVTRSSAAPGREAWNFQIRGATSLNSTDPLIIIDGVPVSSPLSNAGTAINSNPGNTGLGV